jgi:hypothetical protein
MGMPKTCKNNVLFELDKHATDKEPQHTDDFMFCAAPFHFCFVLEPKL